MIKVQTDAPGLDDARSAYIAATPRSADFARSASAHVAQEVIRTLDLPHSLYIASAHGPFMEDVDGNRYIDMAMGFGSHVLGHRPDTVSRAVREQLDRGWQFGLPDAQQQDVAALVQDAAPAAERVAFANSGTEATMYAMRVARAFTGKSRVAVFDGNYHGMHDYALVNANPVGPRNRPIATTLSRGVPTTIAQDTMLVLPYLDEAAFDLVREHRDELAAVVVQPVQNRTPHLDAGPWLAELQRTCRASNVLFVLDEVVTGFRVAWGGCQELFGLHPDLATYGKAIGGGFPIGAVAGRADIMALFHDRYGADGILAGGTSNGNAVSMAAAAAALTELRARRAEIYRWLNVESDRLASSVNSVCLHHGYGVQMMNAGSIFCMRFQGGSIRTSRDVTHENLAAADAFYLRLLHHRVIIPGIRMCFLSAAHQRGIVDDIATAIECTLAEVRELGFL